MNQFRYLYLICLLAAFAPHIARAQDESASTIKAPVLAEPVSTENSAGPFEYGSVVILETYGIQKANGLDEVGGWYVLQPTLKYRPYQVAATLQVAYTKPYSAETEELPEGAFDNPSATLSQEWVLDGWIDQLIVGVIGTVPANTPSRELTFEGSTGPLIRLGRELGRWKVAQAFVYQRRFFREEQPEDDVQNYSNAVKTLTELGYRVSDRFTITSSFSTVAASAAGARGSGTRALLSLDYRLSDPISTSFGVMTERGLTTSEGLSGELQSSQAFFDLIVEI